MVLETSPVQSLNISWLTLLSLCPIDFWLCNVDLPPSPSWDKLAPHELSFNSVWTAELNDSSTTSSMLCTVTPRLKGKNKAKKLIKDQRDLNDSHTSSASTPCQGKNNLFEKPFHNIKAGIMKTLSLIKILAQSWQKSQSWYYQDILHKGTCRDLIGSMTSIFISWHVLSKKCQGVKNLKTMQRRLLNQVGMFQLANS